MSAIDTFTLWDGSAFFTMDGARKYAKIAHDLGARATILVDVEDPSFDIITLELRYVEKTGRGSRTRQGSTHIQNPESFTIWANQTEVVS